MFTTGIVLDLGYQLKVTRAVDSNREAGLTDGAVDGRQPAGIDNK